MSVSISVTIRNELVIQLIRSKGKPNNDRFEADCDLRVCKVFGSSVSALILSGLSDAGYPGGSSIVRTGTSRVRVSYSCSLGPEKKDANAAAYDGNP